MNREQEYLIRFGIIIFTIILTFAITTYGVGECLKDLTVIKETCSERTTNE